MGKFKMGKFKSIICMVLAVLLVVSCLAGCTGGEQEEFDVKKIVLTDEQSSDIDSEIEKLIESETFYGGVSVMLNENEVYKKCFGVANSDGDYVDENTQFLLNSATMAFTAVAVHQLDEEGKLSLSDNLSKFYDSGQYSYLYAVTIEDLLNVSVSFGDYRYEMSSNSAVQDELVKKSNSKKKNAGEKVREMIEEHILNKGIVSGDGAKSNYYILGRIIEKASGMGYDEYLKKNIFDKLGLTNTGFVNSETEADSYHLTTNKWVSPADYNMIFTYDYLYSCHGMVSSLDDVTKFYRAVLDKQLCKADIVKKALKKGQGFSYGFETDGKMLYIDAGVNIHLLYVCINPETEEIAIAVAYTVSDAGISELGKEIYRKVNSKVNGIILEHLD